MVPGGAIADTDQQLVEIGIVDDRVPYRAAAAQFPPVAMPGCAGEAFKRFVRCGAIGPVRRISGHCIEAPDQLPAIRVIGGQIAADAQFRARIADDHLAAHHARGHCDRIGLGPVDGDDVPQFLSTGRVEGNQPPVDRADKDFAFPNRDTAIDHVAAGMGTFCAVYLGIEPPQYFARGGVGGENLRPCGRDIYHAVDNDRRCFLSAIGIQFDRECETKVANIARIHLIEWAVALLLIGAAMGEPVIRVAFGGQQPRFVDCALLLHRYPCRHVAGRHHQETGRCGQQVPDHFHPSPSRDLARQGNGARRINQSSRKSGGVAAALSKAIASSTGRTRCSCSPSVRSATVPSSASRFPTTSRWGTFFTECSRTL